MGNFVLLKPHQNASGGTVTRWLKPEISASGIDIACYKAHDYRAALSSKDKVI